MSESILERFNMHQKHYKISQPILDSISYELQKSKSEHFLSFSGIISNKVNSLQKRVIILNHGIGSDVVISNNESECPSDIIFYQLSKINILQSFIHYLNTDHIRFELSIITIDAELSHSKQLDKLKKIVDRLEINIEILEEQEPIIYDFNNYIGTKTDNDIPYPINDILEKGPVKITIDTIKEPILFEINQTEVEIIINTPLSIRLAMFGSGGWGDISNIEEKMGGGGGGSGEFIKTELIKLSAGSKVLIMMSLGGDTKVTIPSLQKTVIAKAGKKANLNIKGGVNNDNTDGDEFFEAMKIGGDGGESASDIFPPGKAGKGGNKFINGCNGIYPGAGGGGGGYDLTTSGDIVSTNPGSPGPGQVFVGLFVP